MPRPLIGTAGESIGIPELLTSERVRAVTTSPHQLDRCLRRRRSSAYVAAMVKLDAGEYLASPEKVECLVSAIRQELPEVTIEHLPLGIVAKCYLGDPYEVHTLDVSGGIVLHYKFGEGLPGPLERARSLAAPGKYAFVEVYSDALRAIDENGVVSVVRA